MSVSNTRMSPKKISTNSHFQIEDFTQSIDETPQSLVEDIPTKETQKRSDDAANTRKNE